MQLRQVCECERTRPHDQYSHASLTHHKLAQTAANIYSLEFSPILLLFDVFVAVVVIVVGVLLVLLVQKDGLFELSIKIKTFATFSSKINTQ